MYMEDKCNQNLYGERNIVNYCYQFLTEYVFADNCVPHRNICNQDDQITLQNDLDTSS